MSCSETATPLWRSHQCVLPIAAASHTNHCRGPFRTVHGRGAFYTYKTLPGILLYKVIAPASRTDHRVLLNTWRVRVEQEDDEGNQEYKLQLINPSPERFVHLVTQCQFRVSEGEYHWSPARSAPAAQAARATVFHVTAVRKL